MKYFQTVMFQSLKLIRTGICKNICQKNFTVSVCVNKNLNENNSLDKSAKDEVKTVDNSQSALQKRNERYIVEEKDKGTVNRLKKGDILYPYKDPLERFSKIIAEDFKLTKKKVVHMTTGEDMGDLEPKYFPRYTDILIIGGGALGVITAYQIRNKFPYGPNVIVVDREKKVSQLSANLAQATLTQQLFTEEEEIEMSQYCVEFLSSFHRMTRINGFDDLKVEYEPMGGLLLADENCADKLLLKSEVMKRHGIKHTVLGNDKLKGMFPWLNLDGVILGSLGMASEGLFDPWSFLKGIKCKAINLGVTFVNAEVVDFGLREGSPTNAICRLSDGTYNSIDFAFCVIAAGIDTLNLSTILNNSGMSELKLKLPIEERKRYEYCFHNPNGPGLNTPIVIDVDGTYFRREGLASHYIAGVPSIPNNEYGEDELFYVFEDKVKPFLSRRLPDFENIELVSGWTDKYEINTGNYVGILGPHPSEYRIIFASGFSQLGLQYIPAVGRAIMELIVYNKYLTINFDKFDVENLYKKQHMEAERKAREIASQYRISLPV